MTISRGPSPAALALVSLLLSGAPAFAQWYTTYDEGVRFAGSSDPARLREAEKLLKLSIEEAKKERKSPGPNVLRTSQDRRAFSPDFYLAQVYLKLNRTLEADAALQDALTRNEIRQNDPKYVALRKDINAALAANNPSGGGTRGDPPPPPAPDPEVARRTQFDQAMNDARGLLTAKRFDEAASAATRARSVNVDNAAADGLLKSIDFERSIATAESDLLARRFEVARAYATRARESGVDTPRASELLSRINRESFLAQAQTEMDSRRFNPARSFVTSAERLGAEAPALSTLRRRIDIAEAEDNVRAALATGNAANASKAIAALSRLDPNNPNTPAFSQAVTALMTGDAQRLALLQFYAGNYAETIRILTPLAEKADAAPRVHFYLACSRAALALLGAPDAAALLESAREQYRKAAGSGGAALAADRRYVSPRILRALTER